jgi:hypothetical protein
MTIGGELPTPTSLTVNTHGAPSNALGFLGYASAESSLPLMGGTLLIDPTTAVIRPIISDSQGEHSLTGNIGHLSPGTTLYIQTAFVDASSSTLFLSNGLRVDL